MAIHAWLNGEMLDLQDLAEFLKSGDVRVIRSGEKFYLTAPELDNLPADVLVPDAAEQLLARVNGLARA